MYIGVAKWLLVLGAAAAWSCIPLAKAQPPEEEVELGSSQSGLMAMEQSALPVTSSMTVVVDQCAVIHIIFTSEYSDLEVKVLTPTGLEINRNWLISNGWTYLFYPPSGPDTTGESLIFESVANGGSSYEILFPSFGPGNYTVQAARASGSSHRSPIIVQTRSDSKVVAELSILNNGIVFMDRPLPVVLELFDGDVPVAAGPITLQLFPALDEFNHIIPTPLTFRDDGMGSDAVANDGVYSALVLPSMFSGPIEHIISGNVSFHDALGHPVVRTLGRRFKAEYAQPHFVRDAAGTPVVTFTAVGTDGLSIASQYTAGTVLQEFFLQVTLETISGKQIQARGSVIGSSTSGDWITALLPGDVILATTENGPYKVTSMRLYTNTAFANMLLIDVANDLSIVSPSFTRFDFGGPPVVINQVASESVVDTNHNGKIDWLTISAAFVIREAGVYQFSASLMDSCDEFIAFAEFPDLSSGAGTLMPFKVIEISQSAIDNAVIAGGAVGGLPYVVNFSFRGDDIGRHGLNGPYSFRDVEYSNLQTKSGRFDLEYDSIAYVGGIFEHFEMAPDCNNNGIPDRCEIKNGISPDENLNGIPDGCECVADFDKDGFITGDDFDSFVSEFELGVPSADINGDGFITGDDFDLFVAAFESGC